MNWRKAFALLFVGMMTISGLVAISAPVVADTEIVDNVFEVVFDDNTMLGEMLYYIDESDTSFFLLGEGDGVSDDTAAENRLTIEIQCLDIDTGNVDDVLVNVTDFDSNVFDFQDDNTATAAPDYEGTPVSGAPWDPASDGDTEDYTWEFDILETDLLGTSADTTIECSITWLDSGAAPPEYVSEVDFNVEIYISSIFDNPTNEPDEQLPNMQDETEDPEFEAGDMFEEAEMDLRNYDDDAIDDLTCVVTLPGTPPGTDGITFSGDRDTCWIPDGIPATTTDQTLYRVDVAAGTAPGVYPGSADITYTRIDSGLFITESNLGVDFEVDFSFDDDDPVPDAHPYSNYQMVVADASIIEYSAAGTRMTESGQASQTGENDETDENDESNAADEDTLFGSHGDEVNPRNNAWFIPSVAIASLIAVSVLLYKRKQK